jgi:hypothetical protein
MNACTSGWHGENVDKEHAMYFPKDWSVRTLDIHIDRLQSGWSMESLPPELPSVCLGLKLYQLPHSRDCELCELTHKRTYKYTLNCHLFKTLYLSYHNNIQIARKDLNLCGIPTGRTNSGCLATTYCHVDSIFPLNRIFVP